MAQKPIAMEQLKQVRQLQEAGIPIREMARRVGISRNSVRKYLARLADKPVIVDKDLADIAYYNDLLELEAERLRQVTAHFISTRKELSRTGVTRQLLWKEYLLQHPDGYSYSRYCHHLQTFLKNHEIIKMELHPRRMYQNHKEAPRAIDKAVMIYNSRRPHNSLDNKTLMVAHDLTGEIPKR